MREILFRAKRIDNGKWVEGNDIMHKTVRGKLCLANVGEDWVESEWFCANGKRKEGAD